MNPVNGKTMQNLYDAFFGGRTNATKLFYQCEGEEKIRLEKVTYYYGVRMCVVITVQKCCACAHGRTKSVHFLDMWILPAFIRGVTSQQEW